LHETQELSTKKMLFGDIKFTARKWPEYRILHHLPQIPGYRGTSLRESIVFSKLFSVFFLLTCKIMCGTVTTIAESAGQNRNKM